MKESPDSEFVLVVWFLFGLILLFQKLTGLISSANGILIRWSIFVMMEYDAFLDAKLYVIYFLFNGEE